MATDERHIPNDHVTGRHGPYGAAHDTPPAARQRSRVGGITASTFDSLELVSLYRRGATWYELAERLGATEATTKKRLRRLVNRGLLEVEFARSVFPPPPGVYRLTREGLCQLRAAYRAIDEEVSA